MSLGFAAALPCSAGPTGSLNDQQANNISLLNSFLKTRSWGHLWCPGDPLFHRPSHPRLPQRLPRTRRERRLLPPGGDMLEGKAHLWKWDVLHVLGGRIPGCSWSGGLGSMPPDGSCPFSCSQAGGWWSSSGTLRNLQQVLTSSHKVQHRGQDTWGITSVTR